MRAGTPINAREERLWQRGYDPVNPLREPGSTRS
jgi:hypothetical protein